MILKIFVISVLSVPLFGQEMREFYAKSVKTIRTQFLKNSLKRVTSKRALDRIRNSMSVWLLLATLP
jgi:hypothetical protein